MDELDVDSMSDRFLLSISTVLSSTSPSIPSRRASSIDASVKANTIAANKDGFIASLTTLAGDVTKVLEAAAQAAKDADLDYNGDGKVNVQDLVDADSDFQKTGDGFTFYKFLDAYLEYLSK